MNSDASDEVVLFEKPQPTTSQLNTSIHSRTLSTTTVEEDEDEDIGLYDDVYISLKGGKRVFGSFCLFKVCESVIFIFIHSQCKIEKKATFS